MFLYLVIAGIVLTILFSAFFSAAEMSFSSVNTVRLENDAKDGKRGAKTALKVAENFDDALSAILIGNNLFNIAASSLTTVLALWFIEQKIVTVMGEDELNTIATAVLTILIIIFGETIPKITAKKSSNGFAVAFGWLVRFFMIIFYPVVKLVVFLANLFTSRMKQDDNSEESVDELQSIIETAEDEGVLDKDRTELVQAAIDFEDISAYEVMTARVDMDAIDVDDSYEDIIKFIHETPYTRIPVYEESIDNIIGVVHLNKLLKTFAENPKTNIRSILYKPCFVYKTTKLPTVLAELREAKQHLAIVSDEYSGTLGVITMEDVLEQIVGDIWDESDEVEKDVVKRSDNEFTVDGDMIISDFIDLCGLDEDEFDCDSDTVGGFVIETFGTYPKKGDEVEYENITFKVIEMDERRIGKLIVKINPVESDND
ncbi:MAG: HlyC/CorC family transporter [Lachnospiraceae bacterium]|jgi:CBS domain containing-hemolysin-like protein|nr:HlyC/CorC family transporter [Lachnospiraceae bacterium]